MFQLLYKYQNVCTSLKRGDYWLDLNCREIQDSLGSRHFFLDVSSLTLVNEDHGLRTQVGKASLHLELYRLAIEAETRSPLGRTSLCFFFSFFSYLDKRGQCNTEENNCFKESGCSMGLTVQQILKCFLWLRRCAMWISYICTYVWCINAHIILTDRLDIHTYLYGVEILRIGY